MKIALIAFTIGLASGAIAALCGVGGGLLMVPAFVTLLNMPQKVAVATSLAIIVPTALSSSIMNWRNGIIDKQVLLWTALGAVLTAVFFTSKLKSMSDTTLTKLFAVFAIAMGLKLWFTDTGDKKVLAPEIEKGASSASTTEKPD
jgi:uncharacterized membrane protein YfcA